MILMLDREDLNAALRRGTGKEDLVVITGLGEDEMELVVRGPAKVAMRLKRFRVQGRTVSAELTPWWVRSIAAVALHFKQADIVEIHGGRVIIRLPAQATDQLVLDDVLVGETGVTVRARLRKAVGSLPSTPPA